MIKFFCPQFEIEFSHLPITLVEENPRFISSNLRNYSLPFSFDADDDTSKKLGFIEDHQSRKRSVRHLGKLQFLDRFESAILYLYSIKKGKIQGKIDFGEGTLPILETNLVDLPFAPVSVPNIITHATETLSQNWPQARYNFPRIIDRSFLEDTKKNDKFLGFINNQDADDSYLANRFYLEEGKKVVYNRNFMSPCIYVMEILKVGFDFAGITMYGDFINDLANRRILIYSKKFLEELNSDLVNIFPRDFELTDLLPDMTFGTFLNKLRNWFNLDITYRKSMVTINYLERHFKDTEFKKAVHLENDDVDIVFNEKLAYQLVYDEQTQLAVDARGNAAVMAGLTSKEIEKIDFDLTVLRQAELEGVTTAEILEEDEDFVVVIYNGLQAGKNTTPAAVYGRDFTLPQIYELFWKNWINFRLNADFFTDKYDTENDEVNINGGLWKYQNKHLLKKITRKITHVNDQEIVSMTVESETIF